MISNHLVSNSTRPQFSEHMDPSIQWNIALCNLIPAAAPFMQTGMSSICPLKNVTLFVLQLTRRHGPPNSPSFHLPLMYDNAQNSLTVYIPQTRNAAAALAALPYLSGIDERLRQYNNQFRAQGCVIAPSIRQLLTTPNLLVLRAYQQ